MTAPLTQTEKESILTLCLMAAFADGGKSDVERAALKRIAENFPESDVNLAALYHRVLLRQVSTVQTAQALTNAEARQLAYEMAVCVCEADDVLNEPEKQFLAELRRELQLNTAETARIEQRADGPGRRTPGQTGVHPASRDCNRAGCRPRHRCIARSGQDDPQLRHLERRAGAAARFARHHGDHSAPDEDGLPHWQGAWLRTGSRAHQGTAGGGGRGPDLAGGGRLRAQAPRRAAQQAGRRHGQVSGQARCRFRDVLRHDVGAGSAGACNTTPADARFPPANYANSSARSRNRPAVCTETTPAPSARRPAR